MIAQIKRRTIALVILRYQEYPKINKKYKENVWTSSVD